MIMKSDSAKYTSIRILALLAAVLITSFICASASGSAPEAEAQIVTVDNAIYTYEQMLSDLQQLEGRYAPLIRINELGKSHDGRVIAEAMIGSESAEKHILIQASIHGREHMNTLVAMSQIECLLAGYHTESYNGVPYSQLLKDFCFHIIPMSNPDGVTISQMGLDGINSLELRDVLKACYQNDKAAGKASSSEETYWERWKANAVGVDLNRNFDSGWENYTGSINPSFEKYKGAAPASEPETQAILSVNSRYPLMLTISYHSTGSVIYWDYGSSGSLFHANRRLAKLVSDVTGYAMKSSVQSAQNAAGCSDYFTLEPGIPSVTIENGVNACPLPASEFASIWKSNMNLLSIIALNYADDTPQRYSGEATEIIVGNVYMAGVNEFLSLRDKPATSGGVLRKLPPDTAMMVLEITNEDFCKTRVCDTGEEGYVMTKYLY